MTIHCCEIFRRDNGWLVGVVYCDPWTDAGNAALIGAIRKAAESEGVESDRLDWRVGNGVTNQGAMP